MATGIYRIRNTVTGKIYIGQSWDIDSRMKQYKKGLYPNLHMRNSVKKYGWGAFTTEIIQEFDADEVTQEILDKEEIAEIKKYDATRLGYNKRLGGSRGKASAQLKERFSAWQRGRSLPQSHIEAMSVAKRAENLSSETRQKLSRASALGSNPRARPVLCVETGEIFDCGELANRWLGKTSVYKCLYGKCRTAGGYHWQYVQIKETK